jgi:hypothetical protein
MNNLNTQNLQVTIDIVRGGFVLTYPYVITSVVDGSETLFERKEVFTSSNKMKKRISEVLESFKLTDEV